MEVAEGLGAEAYALEDLNCLLPEAEFILGADYGLKNSCTILGEYRFNGASKTDYFGTSLGYQPTPLVTLALLHIIQLKDRSSFTAPSIGYSISDEMTLRGGAFFYNGAGGDEFGNIGDNYYLHFYVHF